MPDIALGIDEVHRAIRELGYGIDFAHGYAIAIAKPSGSKRSDGSSRMVGAGGVRSHAVLETLLSGCRNAREAAKKVIAISLGESPEEVVGSIRSSRAEASEMDRESVQAIASAAVAEALASLGIDKEAVELLATLKKGKLRAPRSTAKKAPSKKKPAKKPHEKPPANEIPPAIEDLDDAEEWIGQDSD